MSQAAADLIGEAAAPVYLDSAASVEVQVPQGAQGVGGHAQLMLQLPKQQLPINTIVSAGQVHKNHGKHLLFGGHVLAKMNNGSAHEKPGRNPNMESGSTSAVCSISTLLVRELHTPQATVGTDRGR